MTNQYLCIAALLLAQSANGFVLHPAKTSSIVQSFPAPGASPAVTLQATADDYDFELPPGLKIEDEYEQGKVPLYNVVNATMRTSKLIYAFSSMKQDIRNNPDEWVDGSDMLKEGTLMEEDIGDFVRKNRARVEGCVDYSDMIDYELGIKGDNRLRCVDAKDSNVELVYGINVNRSRKQVTVAFRGTNTPTDMLVDLDIRKYEAVDGDQTYEIHNGFRNYLNAQTAAEGDGDMTKLEQITEKLEGIMESDCEGFDVFVTGHSLGGALATLYGLRLAESRKFPVVNVVSFASPYVGTAGFKKVFRQAELDGIIRHIRVSNCNDCIPANPCIGGFKHVGVNLELRSSGPVMNYEGVENPSLPVAFIAFGLSAASLVFKFLSIFIGFLGFLPTFAVVPTGVLAFSTVNILLNNHMFPEHRQRFRTNLKSTDFLTKTIDEVYETRLKSIVANGV